MAASAERCSTLIWRGLGGMASVSVPRAAAAPAPVSRGLHSAAMRARVGWLIAVPALVLALAAPAAGQEAPTLGAPPTPNVTVNSGPSPGRPPDPHRPGDPGPPRAAGEQAGQRRPGEVAGGAHLRRGDHPDGGHRLRDPPRLGGEGEPPGPRPRGPRAGRRAAPPQ